jgi:hypothetical protein
MGSKNNKLIKLILGVLGKRIKYANNIKYYSQNSNNMFPIFVECIGPTQGVPYSLKPRITCVHAPYLNTPIYILFLLKSSNILTNLIASKCISIRT